MPAGCNSLRFRLGSAVALALLLAGCTPGGQFDPTEIFNSDVFDSKTKVKGDREPLFPGGVPGTTTGVPADLVKGYQPPPDQADATTAPTETAPVAAAPKPGRNPSPNRKSRPYPPRRNRVRFGNRNSRRRRHELASDQNRPSATGRAAPAGVARWADGACAAGGAAFAIGLAVVAANRSDAANGTALAIDLAKSASARRILPLGPDFTFV